VKFGYPVTADTFPPLDCRSTLPGRHTVGVTDAPTPPAAAPAARPRRRLQPHHAVFALLIVVVVVCVVVLFKKAESGTNGLDNSAIDRLIPAPDAKILQQDTIGIDLADGYTATLALNGTTIPDDQLTIVPQLNQVTFTPGPGKDTQLIPAQKNCLVATYWLLSTGPSQSKTQSWCFTVF
jgi:hypothetical protein